MEDLIVTLDNSINTSDEVRDLGLYWSFLQVLDHHVGYSSQVTHVASPGTTISPDIHRHPYYLQLKALILRKITQEPTEGRLLLYSIVLLPGIKDPLKQLTLLEELRVQNSNM